LRLRGCLFSIAFFDLTLVVILFSFFDIFSSFQFKPQMRIDKSRVWPTHAIPVCWEEDYPDFPNEKNWTQDSVHQLLELNSDYKFAGWPERCGTTDDGAVRISVVDEWPLTDIGYRPRGVAGPTRLRLNFKFTAWATSCASEKVGADGMSIREHCIRTIAVHEMLHALGALHEQLDPKLKEKDPDCYRVYDPILICESGDDQCGQHPVALTAYDHDSIMNYCRNGASGNFYDLPVKLSDADKAGLRDLSGKSGIFE
jgi:Astacin (Peptidase family M12A)